MYSLNKYFMILAILTSTVPVYTFDMDAALAIYQAEQNQNIQGLDQPAPQQHTREYYQKKWQEQQGQQKHTQAAPEPDDLFLAAVNGSNNQIGKLLAQGLDVNISNNERETALHMAAARGHYSTVIYLINNGAYANARTIKNWLPLHHAVRFRHPNIANYLVKNGVSVHEKTSDGMSAIDMARTVNDYRMLSILGADR